jgi:FtsH-binding integral membrane protein
MYRLTRVSRIPRKRQVNVSWGNPAKRFHHQQKTRYAPVKTCVRWISGKPPGKWNNESRLSSHTSSTTSTTSYSKPKSAGEVVSKNRGLNKFVQKVYHTTGFGIAGSLALAQGLHMSDLAVQCPLQCLIGGFVVALTGTAGLHYGKYKVKKRGSELYAENDDARIAGYTAICAGMGTTISPMVSMVTEISPTIFPAATGVSLAVMAGASWWSYRQPEGALLSWQAPLMGGLIGLIGVSLTGLLSGMIFGPQCLAFQMLHSVDTYGGILLFTGFTAYDTHKAIERYKKGDPDHLGCATELYLDFMNLLVRIMEVMAKAQKK